MSYICILRSICRKSTTAKRLIQKNDVKIDVTVMKMIIIMMALMMMINAFSAMH